VVTAVPTSGQSPKAIRRRSALRRLCRPSELRPSRQSEL